MKKLEDLKVGDILICVLKDNGKNSKYKITIDKIISIVNNFHNGLYIHELSTKLHPTTYTSGTFEDYNIYDLYDYIENKDKYIELSEYKEEIESLIKEFFELDVVEGRKYKLKLLEKKAYEKIRR